MRLKKDSSKQKLIGAYYTPQKLANAMVRLFASENIDAVLEPSCGDGVFLDALKETGLLDKVSRVEAVEIETPEAQKVSGRYKDTPKVKVINRDFFDFYKETLGKKTYMRTMRKIQIVLPWMHLLIFLVIPRTRIFKLNIFIGYILFRMIIYLPLP